MTILLLPLTVFRVDYQLASGRPYSQLDELVLRAIAQKEARTIDELHQFFCLPKRLITESLITLAKVGWIAISNKGGGFKSTSSGNAVVNSPKKTLPNSIKLNPPGNDDIVMERVTGQLIRSDHITYELEHKLKEKDILDDAHIIKAEFLGNNLSQGQIHNLLLWDRTKWIYYIDTPKPYKEAWLMVNVNNGKITNLPDRWWNLLEDRLLEEAEKVAHENPELVNKIAESSFQKSIKDEKDEWDGTYSTPIELQDLLLTHRQHIEQLKAALAKAKSTVLIASAFLDKNCLEPEVRGWILAALDRGVNVDLLWGYRAAAEGQPEKTGLDWLDTLQKEAKKSGARGELFFNSARTDSHAKLLIYDTDTGYRAYVGSYEWLFKPTQVEPNGDVFGSNVTVGLYHPGLIANLCMSVAGFWESQGKPHIYAPSRWQRIAQKLGQESVLENEGEVADTTDPQVCQVRIIHDREHGTLMHDWLLTAQRRCAIVSHQLGQETRQRLASLKKRSYENFTLVVQYGGESKFVESFTPEEKTAFMQEVQETVTVANGKLENKPGLHSKVLVADNQAIICSDNFLTAERSNAKNYREIGVLIEGGMVPDKLWEIFG